jgi:uncharacterized protein YjlB
LLSQVPRLYHLVMRETNAQSVRLEDDGRFPNNGRRPLLLYPGAVPKDPRSIEEIFRGNGWPPAWRNGVYPYHHYHSTAHEVLGVFSGVATVRFGGEKGVTRELRAGDVVVIPAGVAHKRLSATRDFAVVGAYPRGQSWDLMRGEEGERPRADRNIAAVPDPESDPVHGAGGVLSRLWR